jgi:tryptophanyl-tRNA synthetase
MQPLAEQPLEDVISRFGSQQFSVLKQDLAELAVEKLSPVAGEMQRLMDDPGHIDAVLKDGAGKRARAIADPVMQDVRQIIGFIG